MADEALEQALELALQQHRAGNLPEAARLYRQVLAAEPDDSDALHLLGLVAHQSGRHEEAVDLLRRAVALEPADALYHRSLATALQALRRHDEAIRAFRQALDLDPDDAEALTSLANILLGLGRFDEAIAALRDLLRVRPTLAEAHNNLGTALHMNGQPEDAIEALHHALRLRPDLPEAHNNLGNALKDLRRYEEAAAAFHQALRLRPDYAEAHSNLGNTLQAQGNLEEAVAAYQRALHLRPTLAETWNNLGNAFQAQDKWAEAVAAYQQALALRPEYAAAHGNLGNALQAVDRLDDAAAAFQTALRLRPDYAEAWANLANTLHAQGKLDDAIAACEQALRVRPDYAQAHANLGNALLAKGRVEDSLAAYRLAVRLAPDSPEIHTNMGNALQVQGELDQAEDAHRRALELRPLFPEALNNLGSTLKDRAAVDEAIGCYRRAIELKPAFATAHGNLAYLLHFRPACDAAEIAAEHRRWACAHARLPLLPPPSNSPDLQRRLRIGYVSPDFRSHCQSLFTGPLLRHHDHAHFEIFCYADVPQPDGVTRRLMPFADVWRDTTTLSDAQLAELVRADRIDILVDLTMHMARSRLLVFARKPAPVQVTWLAYPGTTGLHTIDARLSDPHLDPPGADDSCYTERTLRLPRSFWCFDPHGMDDSDNAATAARAPVTPLPAIANGHITFGCLNNFCKINSAVLTLWARVLQAVPDSRLLLLAPRGRARAWVLEELAAGGAEAGRIEFVERLPRDAYMAVYQRIDLSLDTFPYNGHTTTLDGLWMGVPVVTLAGNTAVGRGGVSILRNLDLADLAAATPEEFLTTAVTLATDLPRLAGLRAALRQRLTASPLMNAPAFARAVESAYHQLWQHWCTNHTHTQMTNAK